MFYSMTWSVLVKSTDAELQILRANYKFIHRYLTEGQCTRLLALFQVSCIFQTDLCGSYGKHYFVVPFYLKKKKRWTILWKYFEIFILCKLATYISILKTVLHLRNLQLSYYLVQWFILCFNWTGWLGLWSHINLGVYIRVFWMKLTFE